MDSNKTPETKKISSENTASSNNDNKISGLAVAALVMAFFVPPVGLVLAIVALVQIKKSKETGKGIATAALVVSSLLILVFIMVWALFIGLLFSVDKAAKDSVGTTNKAEVTVKNNDTQSSEKGNAGLPEGFPSDFPIYPGGKISASSKTDGTYTVSFDTDDSKSKVEAYYKANLASNGWTSGEGTSSNDFGTSSTTTLKKDDSYVNVIVRESTQDTPTSASIIIYKKM